MNIKQRLMSVIWGLMNLAVHLGFGDFVCIHIFYYLATSGPKGHGSGSIHFSAFNHAYPAPDYIQVILGHPALLLPVSAKKSGERENRKK